MTKTTVTPTISPVGILLGSGPSVDNSNSCVPTGIGPVDSSSSSEKYFTLFTTVLSCDNFVLYLVT